MIEEFSCSNYGINGKGSSIHYKNVADCCRTLFQAGTAGADKQFLAVRRNVIEVFTFVAESDALTQACCNIIAYEIGSLSPSRLPVVHLKYLINLFILLRTFFLCINNKVIFCRADGVAAIWHIGSKTGALASFGVNLYEMFVTSIPFLFYISSRTRHPPCITTENIYQSACPYISQFSTPL